MSIMDAAALAAFGGISAGLYRRQSDLWWLVAVVAVHFFLFCNVFRVLRRRELIWAAVFLMIVGLSALSGQLSPFVVLACQLPVSVGIIAWEVRAPRYHGVLAEWLNPRLNEYLEGETEVAQPTPAKQNGDDVQLPH